MNATEWRNAGQLIEVNGHHHHVYDSKSDKPCLLILHGYPTCGYDYYKALPLLEAHFRVVVHDHLGFGYSDKPLKYSYSLMEQTDQALMLWKKLGIVRATLLAHDYGTSIATEILARQVRFGSVGPKIGDLVLCNGSMHIEMSKLRLIQKLLMREHLGPWVAKRTSKTLFARNIRNIYFDASQVSDEEINALWEMVTHNDGRLVLAKITQYIKQRYRYWHRWIGALKTTTLPIKIVWAKHDPVAVEAMAHQLHSEISNSQLYLLDDLGHFPMLENPAYWTETVIQSLTKE